MTRAVLFLLLASCTISNTSSPPIQMTTDVDVSAMTITGTATGNGVSTLVDVTIVANKLPAKLGPNDAIVANVSQLGEYQRGKDQFGYALLAPSVDTLSFVRSGTAIAKVDLPKIAPFAITAPAMGSRTKDIVIAWPASMLSTTLAITGPCITFTKRTLDATSSGITLTLQDFLPSGSNCTLEVTLERRASSSRTGPFDPIAIIERRTTRIETTP